MRRTYLHLGLIAAVATTAVIAWRTTATKADPPSPVEQAAKKTLPLTQVVLFSSGVGYFQREGSVEGNTRLDLAFPVTDINDLLKSLVFHDLGNGKISTVSYDSQEPIDRTLKTFALDLTTNPTFGQLLNQARGEKVEIALQQTSAAATGQPATMTGVIVGMEAQTELGKEVHSLNLLCAEGVRCLPLAQVQRMRFLNATLDAEFRRVLEVLATAHNSQKRGVILSLNGEGNRPVKLGYVVESPIWKPTYRLVLDRQGKPSLQGWAIVENTTDEDWKDVRMALVSSRPISFEMDLYQPLFVPRPKVEPELFESLRPPTYQGTLDPLAQDEPKGQQARGGLNLMLGSGLAGLGALGGGLGGQVGGLTGLQLGGQLGTQSSGNFNSGYLGGFNRYQTNGLAAPSDSAQNRLTFEELKQRRQEKQQAKEEAKKVGSAVAAAQDPAAVEAALELTKEIGAYSQYNIEQKVNLPRQKSSLLPIVQHEVEGARVSIYNEGVHPKFPLAGLRFTNTTGQNLMQGPVSVFDGGSYAGDARLSDLQPDEERLLSYAIDLGVEVKPTSTQRPGPKMTVRAGKDGVVVRFTDRQTTTYTIRNRSRQDKTVILEHPITGGWKLAEDGKKPYENSRDLYRFEVRAPAGKEPVKFDVTEEQDRAEPFALTAKTVETGEQTLISPTKLGIEIEQINRQAWPELLGVQIARGKFGATTRFVESRTYRVRNLSNRDREIVLEHQVLPDWKLVGEGKVVEGTKDLYGFHLKLPAGKTVEQQVAEQSTPTAWAALSSLTDEQLAAFQASPAVTVPVKAALKEIGERRGKLARLARETAEVNQRLKTIADEQARLRANIDKVPRESAAYKRYLEKFDTQETEIEKLQAKIEEGKQQQQKLQKEYDEYLKDLKAE
jgi:hypothetical protein